MNILITGGAGFIGSHVADECLREKHSVTVLDDLSMGRRENISPKAAFVKLDIRDESIGDVFRKQKFDVVIHHAAQMDVRKSVEDPIFDASVNILGSLNLLEQCRQHHVAKFIFASTGGAIYGNQDYFPADERHPVRPLSPYGIAKLAVEKYLHYYNLVHGLHYVCLRYANVYGPRQNPHGEAGVVAIFTSRMLAGEKVVINGDGKQTRDYTYVDDVVRANMMALRHDKSGIFNIGTGVETDVNALFQTLRTLTGARCGESHGPAKQGEQERSSLDYAHVKSILGWSPTVSVPEGLERTVKFFKSAK